MAAVRPGRNDPCHCGSGLKYKRCCLPHDLAGENPIRDDFQAQVSRVLRELGPDAPQELVLAKLNTRMEELTGRYNARAQPELGGLSPQQVRRILNADWMSSESALVVSDDLSADELQTSDILFNSRLLLDTAADEEGLGLTATGNLKLVHVAHLFDGFRLDEEYRSLHERHAGRRTETDILPLSRIRVVTELAGLLRADRRRLVLTQLGQDLRATGNAGILQALLLRTWFRDFNLAYGTRFPDWPQLQQQVAFTLCMLRRRPVVWESAEDLIGDVVLPAALETAPISDIWDIAASIVETFLLEPLANFGLMERSGTFLSELRLGRKLRFRRTRLFERMLQFRL